MSTSQTNTQHPNHAKPSFGLSPATIVTLAALTAIAPLGIDMYIASLPTIAEELHTTEAAASMTLSAFMIGMALGQLIIGPLSDKTGRRTPLLIGSAVCIVADTTKGLATAKLMGIMMMINGFAPVLAPLFGGWVLSWGTWRSVFNVLTVITGALMLAVIFILRETLPAEKRYQGTALSVYSEIPKVFKIRRYMGFSLTMCFAFGALFSYISGSTFVLQKILGLDAGQYTLAFGVNSLGIVAMSSLATALVGKVAQRTIVNVGVSALLVVSVLLTGSFLIGISLWPTLILLFCLTCSVGLIFGNASALALNEARHMAGSASAVMGTIQALLGGVAAPLVSLGGEGAYLPMAFSILGFAVLTRITLFSTPRKDSDYAADGGAGGH